MTVNLGIWTPAAALDLDTGQALPETVWDALVSNVGFLGLRQTTDLTNKSTSTRATGDVVVIDTTNDDAFTTTTTPSDIRVLGVVLDPTAVNAVGKVVTSGRATVRVDGATQRGDRLSSSPVEGAATSRPTPSNGDFAIALTTTSGPGMVDAIMLGPGGRAALVPIRLADTQVTTAVPTVTYANIPQVFRHLMIVLAVRSNGPSAQTQVRARFNTDAGANYQHQVLVGTGTTPAAALAQGTSSTVLAVVASGLGAPGGFFNTSESLIGGYANASMYKSVTSRNTGGHGFASGLAGLRAEVIASFWNNAAPITRLDLFMDEGQFIAGSQLSLYGLP